MHVFNVCVEEVELMSGCLQAGRVRGATPGPAACMETGVSVNPGLRATGRTAVRFNVSNMSSGYRPDPPQVLINDPPRLQEQNLFPHKVT